MAMTTYKTWLEWAEDFSDAGETPYHLRIKNYPDLGGPPNLVEYTDLEHDTQVFLKGIKASNAMPFVSNYKLEDIEDIIGYEGKALTFKLHMQGGAIFTWKGQLIVYVSGKGNDDVNEMTIVVAPCTGIARDDIIRVWPSGADEFAYVSVSSLDGYIKSILFDGDYYERKAAFDDYLVVTPSQTVSFIEVDYWGRDVAGGNRIDTTLPPTGYVDPADQPDWHYRIEVNEELDGGMQMMGSPKGSPKGKPEEEPEEENTTEYLEENEEEE